MTFNEQELKSLEEKLIAEKKELEERLKSVETHPDFGDDTDHLEEEADAIEQEANQIGIERSLKDLLREIENALQKMHAGTYGICEECKGIISRELLAIDPESQYCQSCKQKMRGEV